MPHREDYESQRLRQQIDSRYGAGLVPSEYAIVRYIGRGVYGAVYKLKHFKTNEYAALKVGLIEDSEIAIQRQMEKIVMNTFPGNTQMNAIAPHVYHVSPRNKKGNRSILMQLMHGNVEDLMIYYHDDSVKLVEIIMAIEDLIFKLCEFKITHGDLHLQNIAYTRSGSNIYLHIIDFGFSKAKKCNSRVERIQLIRGLFIFYEELDESAKYDEFRTFTFEALKALLRHYNRLYVKQIQLNLKNITSEYHHAQHSSRKQLV